MAIKKKPTVIKKKETEPILEPEPVKSTLKTETSKKSLSKKSKSTISLPPVSEKSKKDKVEEQPPPALESSESEEVQDEIEEPQEEESDQEAKLDAKRKRIEAYKKWLVNEERIILQKMEDVVN